jgi:hypothetical protein
VGQGADELGHAIAAGRRKLTIDEAQFMSCVAIRFRDGGDDGITGVIDCGDQGGEMLAAAARVLFSGVSA